MGWFKVDDQLAFHSKTVAAGNAAMGLWIRSGSWSSAQLTDGMIPVHMANAMANPCDAIALVEAGLWVEVEGGYQFHDWSEFQPDAATEKAKRKATSEARSKAGKAGAAARWDEDKDGKRMANAKQTDGKPMPPTRPDPIKEHAHSSPATPSKDFIEFWDAYPKKIAKKTAIKAWDKAVKTTDPQQIIAGTKKYAELMVAEKVDKKFIKSPDGWLNDGRWDDELPDTNTTTKHNPLWD